MAPPKGSYNARRFHEETGRQVRERLSVALETVARSGVMFQNVSTLAAYVAERCGHTAGNLRRNKAYRAMLEVHLSNQRGAVGVISEVHRDVSILRAKLRVAELEAANAHRDKKRLERFISSHMSRLDLSPSDTVAPADASNGQNNVDYRRAFECTAQALVAVMERAEIFEVDERRKVILDRSARPGNESVVGANHAGFFVEWLRRRAKQFG